MKTQILQLEIHDDVLSTRDKMGWGQASRILLVWPEKGRILTSRLDLVLVQRHSATLGAQLALVTSDPDVRIQAHELGIPIFNTLRQAQRSPWTSGRRQRRLPLWRGRSEPSGIEGGPAPTPPIQRVEEKRPPADLEFQLPWLRVLFFTLGVLALLSIAAILLPGAIIGLDPQTRMQNLTLSVEASPDIKTVGVSGLVPAQAVRVVVEGRQRVKASGQAKLPDGYAAGDLLFTNVTSDTQVIPAGTVVRTLTGDPVRFATRKEGRLKAGLGQTVSLPARALEPGRRGNLPAGTLVAIESSLGPNLNVTNPNPTKGGSERSVPAPAQRDYIQARESLIASLQLTALEELSGELQPGDFLLTTSPSMTQIISADYTPAESQPSDWLTLQLRVEFEGWVAQASHLKELSEAVLEANLPAGYVPVENTLHYEALNKPVRSGSALEWQLLIERQISAALSTSQVVQTTLGKTPPQAIQALAAGFPLESPADITLRPTWWPRLPFIPFRIQVEIR